MAGPFAELRLDGLHDEPQAGKQRTITDEDVERVIVKTLEEQPADATHSSTQAMAKAAGMSETGIRRIWGAFGLKPHLAVRRRRRTAEHAPGRSRRTSPNREMWFTDQLLGERRRERLPFAGLGALASSDGVHRSSSPWRCREART